KNPKVLKPAFTIPPKLLQSLVEDPKWDEKGSVTQNYNSFGVVNDPNSLTDSLRAPPSVSDDPNDSGSDLEEDGQPHEVAESSGIVAIWLIPLHFSFAFQFPLQRFLQCQLKTGVIAWVSLLGLVVNVVLSWLLVYVWDFGLIGAAIALDVSWWVLVIGMFGYTVCGGCPLTWNGFSMEAFSGLWEFFKLSLASGVMLCLENWYYRILLLMTGQLENATVAVDALSVCMTINGWEMMIPFAFFAGTGVRVANELGAGKWKSAKFAMQVSLVQSTVIGLIFCILIVIFKREFAYIFTSSTHVLQTVNDMSILLGVSIVLNSVQPVLSENDDGYKAKSYAAFCCNFREIVYELLHLQEQ
ncbi:hypothetical protein RYX36_024251, partial [Vicia faba]